VKKGGKEGRNGRQWCTRRKARKGGRGKKTTLAEHHFSVLIKHEEKKKKTVRGEEKREMEEEIKSGVPKRIQGTIEPKKKGREKGKSAH